MTSPPSHMPAVCCWLTALFFCLGALLRLHCTSHHQLPSPPSPALRCQQVKLLSLHGARPDDFLNMQFNKDYKAFQDFFETSKDASRTKTSQSKRVETGTPSTFRRTLLLGRTYMKAARLADLVCAFTCPAGLFLMVLDEAFSI